MTRETGMPHSQSETKGKEDTVSQEAMKSATVELHGRLFWKTRTGTKFHIDGCVYLHNKDPKKVWLEEEIFAATVATVQPLRHYPQ